MTAVARLARSVLLVALGCGGALLLAQGCGDGPTGPVEGALTVRLTSPSGVVGAVLFTITSPDAQTIDTVTAACDECRAFVGRSGPTRVTVAVVGAVASGPLVRVSVADVRHSDRYVLALREVAGRTHELLPTGGYELAVGR